jgi:hypothetical protein
MKKLFKRIFPISTYLKESILNTNKRIDLLFEEIQSLIDNCQNENYDIGILDSDVKIVYDKIHELQKQREVLYLARIGNMTSLFVLLYGCFYLVLSLVKLF